jgi:hypothetical protein
VGDHCNIRHRPQCGLLQNNNRNSNNLKDIFKITLNIYKISIELTIVIDHFQLLIFNYSFSTYTGV